MRNLFPDPGFESGALSANRRISSSTVTDVSRVVSDLVPSTDPAFGAIVAGNYSLRLGISTVEPATTGDLLRYEWKVACKPGSVWSLRALSAFVSTGLRAKIRIGWYDGEGNEAGLSSNQAGETGPQPKPAELVLENIEAPPDAAVLYVALELRVFTAGSVGFVTYDDVVLVEGSEVPAEALDGDTGGRDWEGPRFVSPSAELEDAETLVDYEARSPQYLWGDVVVGPEE